MKFRGTLTTEMREAGIDEVLSKAPSTNGSWQCLVDLTKVDHSQNRPKSPSHCTDIAENFSKKFWTNPQLRLVRIGGRLKLLSINGQHRILAAIQAYASEGKKLPRFSCEVHFKMNDQESADFFYNGQQKSRRMLPSHSFAIARKAELEWAKQIVVSLESHGLTCAGCDDGWRENRPSNYDIPNVNELRKAQAVGGVFLDTFLDVLSIWKTHGKLQKAAASCPFMRGLGDFLRNNKVGINTIKARLRYKSAADIVEDAKALHPECCRIERRHIREALQFAYDLRRAA